MGARLAALRRRFAEHDVVALDGAFAPFLIAALSAAVDGALGTHGVRRDVRMAATGGTARRYRIAGRAALAAADPLIALTYRSRNVRRIVEAVAGERVHPVPYEPEEFIATRLEFAGDVHDWHWDDYSYALVWVLRVPEPSAGGGVELVRNVAWNKSDPQITANLRDNPVERFYPMAGTAYLLRANATMHRVAPLREPAVRDVLCFSYAAAADFARTVTHETVEVLTCA